MFYSPREAKLLQGQEPSPSLVEVPSEAKDVLPDGVALLGWVTSGLLAKEAFAEVLTEVSFKGAGGSYTTSHSS